MQSIDFDNACLRTELRKAINAVDINRARSIDNEIKKLNRFKKDNAQNKQNILNRIKYNFVKEKIANKIIDLEYLILTEQTNARTSFQRRLAEIRSRQTEELNALARSTHADIMKIFMRPALEADKMKEEAQKRAAMGKFEEAEALYEESQRIKKGTSYDKMVSTNEKYYQAIEEIKKKHEAEINL